MAEIKGRFSSDDRRRNDRIDAHDDGLRVLNAIDGQPIGIVSNLSGGGMMLISSRELYSNGVLQLDIASPPQLNLGRISLGFRVLWCTPANTPDEYWAGLEIIDISAAGRQALHALLDHLAN